MTLEKQRDKITKTYKNISDKSFAANAKEA